MDQIQQEVIMASKIIIGLIFIFSATINQAQKNKFIPPDMMPKTRSFALPELQVDSTFIASLDSMLFHKECLWMDNNSGWRNFYIHFEKKDSLNYSIYIDLWDIPARNSIGFFEHNEYRYWLGGKIPPNIILETKSKKRFSYKENPPMTVDPPLWILMYHSQTGNIEVKEKYCY
jgi:hypothetical protein